MAPNPVKRSLVHELDKLELATTPGSVLMAGGATIRAFSRSSSRLIQIEDVKSMDIPRIVHLLVDEGLLESPSRTSLKYFTMPGARPGMAIEWHPWELLEVLKQHVSAAFVTNVAALLLPSTSGELEERAMLLERFLANLEDPVPQLYAALLFQGLSIVDCSPTEALWRALWGELPAGCGVIDSGGAWHLRADVGPLSPAREAHRQASRCACVHTAHVTKSITRLDDPTAVGSGIGCTDEEARGRAIGEAYERHLAGLVPSEMVFEACGAEIGNALDPNLFISYLPEQYRQFPELHPYSPNERRVWVRARALNGESCAILADLVFYPFGSSEVKLHTTANSSGMAAGLVFEDAVTAGWLELVERHAFMKMWLGRIVPRRIVWTDAQIAKFEQDLQLAGWSLDLFQISDIEAEGVVMAVAHMGDAVVLGAAGHSSPILAARKAVQEAWMGVMFSVPDEEGLEFDAVRLPSEHRRLYQWGAHAREIDFVLDATENIHLTELEPARPVSEDAIIVSWPKWASAPLEVVRVLHPSLIPITFGFGRDPLGRPDVQDLVAGRPRPLFPHPFP
jgi:ribosomal protein S12 methylthiotransferase accessory factor YcaO